MKIRRYLSKLQQKNQWHFFLDTVYKGKEKNLFYVIFQISNFVKIGEYLGHHSTDTELNFVQHCKEKINTAYSYLGIIKRNFIYLLTR